MKKPKRKQPREKSLFPLLPLPMFPKVIHTLSLHLPPSLAFSLSFCFHCLVALPVPPTPNPPFFSQLSSALAVSQGLCYGQTRHWGLKLSTDVDGDKGVDGAQRGAAAVCVLEGQHTVLPEEPSTTVKCQVTVYTPQCDGEEMLLVWVLHSVNTEHLCHVSPYQNVFVIYFTF